jgi:transcriptional regulator with XRE-family HTH domain
MSKKYKFDKKILSERIKQARKNRNLTQEELSELLNINVITLAKWESPNNKLTMSYTNLIELVNILDIDFNLLFRVRIDKDDDITTNNINYLIDELSDKEKSIVFNLIHSLINNR